MDASEYVVTGLFALAGVLYHFAAGGMGKRLDSIEESADYERKRREAKTDDIENRITAMECNIAAIKSRIKMS